MVLKLSILHKQETIDASLVAPLMDGNSVYAGPAIFKLFFLY